MRTKVEELGEGSGRWGPGTRRGGDEDGGEGVAGRREDAWGDGHALDML